MSTLLLTGKDIRSLLSMSSAIEAIEQAFRELASGKARMPSKSYLVLDQGDFRAMPASLPGAVGVKWVSVYTGNISRSLPTVIGTMLYNDPETGYPLAVMDATDLTAYRTGATAAIASKYMARADSQTLGIVGAGRQAYTQILAHAELFKFQKIRVFDRNSAVTQRLIESLPQYPITNCPIEKVVASDIVCTITPAREPVIRKEWVVPGTHINAIGADAEGKEELEPAILDHAVVVVDDLAQAGNGGEINVPIRKGLFRLEDVYASLGDIISGKKVLQRDNRAITIFDSTGLAIEDVAVAKLIYEKAKTAHRCQSINLID